MILIHAHAQAMRNAMPNPKNYPWWPEVLAQLASPLVQIGLAADPTLVDDFRSNLSLADTCDYWLSVDSFLPHLAQHLFKSGVVLWSKSDPAIFGYPENLNLLKDRKYLRAKQFRIWEEESYDPDAFLDPASVLRAIHTWRTGVAGDGNIENPLAAHVDCATV